MTDGIPSLIERLRAWKALRACDFEENSPLAEDLEAAARALSRLTASPLPEEIAGLIGRLERVINQVTPMEYIEAQCRCAIAALQQRAREVERLKTQLHDSHVSHAKSLSELGNRTIRLGELEAEIIRLAEPPNPPLTMNDALALLNAQAREIERREHRLRDEKHVNKLAIERFQAAEARIRELEVHCERLGQGGAERYWEGRWRDTQAERDKLRETLAGMHCPRQINAGTIADCTGRLECGCNAGAVFVKTGVAQK